MENGITLGQCIARADQLKALLRDNPGKVSALLAELKGIKEAMLKSKPPRPGAKIKKIVVSLQPEEVDTLIDCVGLVAHELLADDMRSKQDKGDADDLS